MSTAPPDPPCLLNRTISLLEYDQCTIIVTAFVCVIAVSLLYLMYMNRFWYSQQELANEGVCIFSSNFDTYGVLYHIGTKGGTQDYTNPHTSGDVVAKWSSVEQGSVGYFVQHRWSGTVVSWTNNIENSWMQVDLGTSRSLRPTHYCLRNDGYTSALRSWHLQGSNDETNWETLRDHDNDTSLPQTSMAAANWTVDNCNKRYRWFRIQIRGENVDGRHRLCCTGIELYGDLDTTQ